MEESSDGFDVKGLATSGTRLAHQGCHSHIFPHGYYHKTNASISKANQAGASAHAQGTDPDNQFGSSPHPSKGVDSERSVDDAPSNAGPGGARQGDSDGASALAIESGSGSSRDVHLGLPELMALARAYKWKSLTMPLYTRGEALRNIQVMYSS